MISVSNDVLMYLAQSLGNWYITSLSFTFSNKPNLSALTSLWQLLHSNMFESLTFISNSLPHLGHLYKTDSNPSKLSPFLNRIGLSNWFL